jgi:hypothetical protein
MELFGIVLSIPAAFFASTLYCLFLVRVVSKSQRASRWLRIASYAVLALFAVEIVLLVTLGAVRSRGVLGPSFYLAHLIFFFIATPALANSLVLHRSGGFFAKWYVATVLCTIFAFCLVLLQYGVSEALHGIDGENGPYSSGPSSTLLDAS